MHDQDTGTLLRRLRLERGWTQRQAAELLGVSAQAVSKWERGQGCPDVGMLPRLAKIFGVSVEGILDGDLLPAAPDGGNIKKIQLSYSIKFQKELDIPLRVGMQTKS